MSRQLERQYFALHRRDEDAIWCPKCKHKTRHFAMPHEDTLDIYCELCHNRLAMGIKPYTRGCYPKDFVKGRFWNESDLNKGE